jgi:hypothetical protein
MVLQWVPARACALVRSALDRLARRRRFLISNLGGIYDGDDDPKPPWEYENK